MPVFAMKNLLSKKEFDGWVDYLNNKQPEIQELQLATLSMLVSVGLGNKKASVSDFIISKPRKHKTKTEPSKVMSNNAVQAALASFATKKMK
jgi:hypothetical protein